MGMCCAWLGCAAGSSEEKGVTKINDDRSCTDIPMLLLYIGWCAAVLIIMGVAIGRGGNVMNIIYGTDYNGNQCTSSAPLIAFPCLGCPMSGTVNVAYTARICVKDCNATNSDPRMAFGMTYTSKQYLQFCLPVVGVAFVNATVQSSDEFSSVSGAATRAIGDLYTAYGLILGSAFLALVLALLYSKLIQVAAGLLVWLSLICILFGGLFASYTCMQMASMAMTDGTDPMRVKAMQGVGITIAIITFLYFCAIVFMRDRIAIAVQVTKEASKSLLDMPMMLFFPIFPFVILCGYFVWWIYTALTIYSVTVKTVVANPTFPSYGGMSMVPKGWPMVAINGTGLNGFTTTTWDTSLQQAMVVHFFHLLWTTQFLIFWTFLVIAGACANWYFTPWNAEGTSKPRGTDEGQLPDSAVLRSCLRTTRYHMGSISFASLIIAIIQFIQACILYAERKAKEANMNETLRCIIFGCLMCFMKCVECCMKQINRNGLVFTAVYGKPFCPAACGAFVLAFANLGRVAWISMVGDFLMGIGKVLVAALTTGLCALILFNGSYLAYISSPAFILTIIFILAWGIGSIFMVVYECAIDTVFMCFLIDEDNNKATGKYLAHPDLLKLIDAVAASPEAQAEAEKRKTDGKVPEGAAAPAAPAASAAPAGDKPASA